MTIDTMPAGPELDALVAEKVMGWHHTEDHGGGLRCGGKIRNCELVPRYSTDISAAWMVRAKMEAEGWRSEDRLTDVGWGPIDKHPYGYSIWFERWVDRGKRCFHDHVSDFNQAPAAICRAALKAKGVA